MTDDLLERALEALDAGGRRSPVYYWMRKNYDALSRKLSGTRPSWSALAAFFRDNGIHDRTGKPPSAKIVGQTWARLLKDMRRRPPVRDPKPPRREWPLAPGEIAPGVRPVAQPPAPATAVSSAPVRMDGVLDELGAQRPWMPKRGG